MSTLQSYLSIEYEATDKTWLAWGNLMKHTLYLLDLIHAKGKQTDGRVEMIICGFIGLLCAL